MTRKKIFILAHEDARNRALEAVRDAFDGDHVTITEPKKSRDQEMKYHAMIKDISKQVSIYERAWSSDDLKRIFVDQFSRDFEVAGTPLEQMCGHPRVVLSLDKTGVVQLGAQTKSFTKKEAAAFIEWLYAFGAEHDVAWSDVACGGYYEMGAGKI